MSDLWSGLGIICKWMRKEMFYLRRDTLINRDQLRLQYVDIWAGLLVAAFPCRYHRLKDGILIGREGNEKEGSYLQWRWHLGK
jgi:hypothetical protein